LPDTGQTASYTATYGEDHDYTSANSTVCDRAASGADASFTNNGDGTITDNCTNLEWKRCVEPDATTTCTGTQSVYSWANAVVRCEGLSYGGHTDWRLPNVNELLSIVNYSVSTPPINETYFPNPSLDDWWTSTTFAGNTTYAWAVYFGGGGSTAGMIKTTATQNVLCVRN
jgi:hypothetical protein